MRIEHLDDLPVIGAQMQKVDLISIVETHFPDHGHWKGISGVQLTFGWMLYILSEGDHRLSHVEDWSALRLNILSGILQESALRRVDFCDDRLGGLLDRFSEDEQWNEFEKSIGKKVVQVYQMEEQEDEDKIQVVRSDSFNAPQYRATGELFRHGYSKQRRSDQPFCKVMMSAIDPLVVPLAVDILKGSGPDADHYMPVIERVQSMFKQNKNLYVGDSQLGSIANRTAIHSSGNYYLCPLSKKQVLAAQVKEYLASIKGSYEELPSLFTEEESKRKPAYFYELKETIKGKEGELKWEEGRILVYSPEYAKGLKKSFNGRLDDAEKKIQNLMLSGRGRRPAKTLKDLHTRIEAIEKQYKVAGCFEITCKENIETKRVQKHKNRAEEIREIITLSLSLKRKEAEIEIRQKKLGWQIYGTNVPQQKMETAELVKNYRDEYRIEHLFDYLLNKTTELLPIYLKKETRVKGLIRLLSLAMKFSMLLQHDVRKELSKAKKTIKGIYPGNKAQSTDRPTTTMLLGAFRGISVVWLDNGKKKIIQMVQLKEKQIEILNLLKIPDAYQHTLSFLETNKFLRET